MTDDVTGGQLLQRILEEPADDTVRLVCADYLDEAGQPERAEFIRVQCRVAAIEADGGRTHEFWDQVDKGVAGWSSPCRCERCVFRRRERELLTAHRDDW